MKKGLIFVFALLLITLLATSAYAQTSNSVGQWETQTVNSGVLEPTSYYMLNLEGLDRIFHMGENFTSGPVYSSLRDLLVAEAGLTLDSLVGLSQTELMAIAHQNNVVFYVTEIDGLTDQIWAVRVEAEPGHTGTLEQNFEAAYGSYGGVIVDPEASIPSDGSDDWFFQLDSDGVWEAVVGDDYVGNYFNIEQLAATSKGTVQRFISVSSPWSHAMVEENTTATGTVEIQEAFVMENIKPGNQVVSDWWGLF